MRRFRREEGNGSREVEGEEQAVDAQARVNPGGEILLQNMHPQVEEDAPQAVADEQSENVPEAAVHPEGMIGGQHPINPVEAGNFPIHPNEEGGEAGNRMERTPNEPSPKQKKICIMVMFVIIFYLIIGTIYFNAYKFQTQNETIPLTDIDVNVTTPVTTTIFTITT
ncbi:unnamed protein product [Larinioides sclopetarius]|uniref:Uncharacterized protein n=1 Tax=Larinioides sclopetarius TaxID=280406 RepID=A0AAV1YZZ4_9ARAC